MFYSNGQPKTCLTTKSQLPSSQGYHLITAASVLHTCLVAHESAVLVGTMQEPRWTGQMAKEYPFKLDTFQSTASACLVRTTWACMGNTTGHGRH